MASSFSFMVNVTLERESGKFMARDEMSEQLIEWIEGADQGQVDGGPDGDSVYTVTDFSVEEVDQKAAKKA